MSAARQTAVIAVVIAAVLGCSERRPAGGGAPSMQREETEALRSPLESPRAAEDTDVAEGVVAVELVAAAHRGRWGEVELDGWAYNGQIPGPTIRARVGQTLRVVLRNQLDAPTTIHWHGVHVPWQMDGVHWNMMPIEPGKEFVYELPLTAAGTFWYHPHFDTHHQVDRGLYGALVVEEPDATTYGFERDVVLVFDTPAEVMPDSDMPDCHGAHEPIATWLVNGELRPTLRGNGGTRIRVRMVNASNCGYLDLTWPGGRHMGGDQGLLAAPQEGLISLAPGDRAEVEWDVGVVGGWVTSRVHTVGGVPLGAPDIEVLALAVDDPAPSPMPAALPFTGLPPSEDPPHTDIAYCLSGSGRTNEWFINGEQFPEITIETLALGQKAVVEVRNLSAVEHPFHLHGMAFEVLSRRGSPPPVRTVEDTLNLAAHEAVRLLVTADNPGDWMAHCHILPHADGGMMTVLRVGAPMEGH